MVDQQLSKTESSLPANLSEAQLSFITQKTPKEYIKTRPGPGGVILSYVEVGYVINMLNQVFGWDWDFRILDQQIGKKQVWVRGELTVRAKGRNITKGQYGGADIKFSRSTGEPISIADDLKAAASDCLKKCASMLGIAGDVYWKELETQAPEEQPKKQPAYSHKIPY
ncbi:RAD52 family DNA repair protein [Patescibacteria group bacterium]|nr:RAD52 family DNA repair protein [Patescibacteria group bacterium]